MTPTKCHTLNGAAKTLAAAFNGSLGIRRTYGGGDDNRRMQITWQIIRDRRVIGLIDLYCEDGFGRDGLFWGGALNLSGPGVDRQINLVSPFLGLAGRAAKRATRHRFLEVSTTLAGTLLKGK